MQFSRTFYYLIIVVVAVVFVSAVGTATAGEFTLLNMNAKEEVYRVIVKSDVAPFEVHKIFKKHTKKKVVEKLNIYRGNKLLQSFTPPEDIELISKKAALLEPEFDMEDVNHDGYDDLKLFTGGSWSYWLYNPQKDRFEEKSEPLKLIDTTDRERIYSLVVKRNVKPLTIKLLVIKNPEEVNDKVKIEIFRGRRLLQTLSTEMMSPPDNAEMLFSEDMNFDGYNDLELVSSWSGMGNDCYSFWLYNPLKETFEYNESLNKLCNPGPDEKDKTLKTGWNGGALRCIYTMQVYKWKGKELVLIGDAEENISDEKKDLFHKVIRRLRNGKMVVVSDRILTYDEAIEENHKGTQLDH